MSTTLQGFTSPADMDRAVRDLEAALKAGEVTRDAFDTAMTMITIRRKALEGSPETVPEGVVKKTSGCTISRVGGTLLVEFAARPAEAAMAGLKGQGFSVASEDRRRWRAPFTTARYLFALDLCAGIEQTQAGLDEDAVRNVVAKWMDGHKIGMGGLSDEVRKAISEKERIHIVQPMGDSEQPREAPSASYVPDYWRILDDVMLGHNVFLVGPAGSGKTFLAEEIARTLGREYLTLNCSQYTSPIDIKGGPTIDGYTEGGLIECWEKGHILILDELPKIDPNTAGLLNEALAKTKLPASSERAIIYNGRNKPIAKADGFGVVATGNIYPNAESATYTANTKQDLSLLDRFSGSVYFIGFNERLEKAVARYLIIYGFGMRLRSFITDNRIDGVISLRWLETARDVFTLERERMDGSRKDSERLDTGKTLKAHIDGVVNTLTATQQKAMRAHLNYDQLVDNYQYRSLSTDKSPYA